MRSTNAVPPVKFSRGRWRWIVLRHLPTSNCSSSTIMETDILFARNPSTSPRLHSTSSTLWIFSCRYYLKKSKFSSFSTLSIFIFFFFFLYSQNTSCIEILHEQFTPQNVPILVHCKSNEDRNEKEQLVSLQSLLKSRLNVRRCCSNNQVFNVMTGNCESSVNVNEDDFLTFFNFIVKEKLQSQNVEIISISKDFFECPNSTAMFTYEIDAEDVVILDESLMVSIFYFTRWARRTLRILTSTINEVLLLYENVDETF